MTDNGRVVAVGFFDGVHIGHAALLNKAKQKALETGTTPAVLSLIPIRMISFFIRL